MNKKAFFVMGPEGSGTYMMTEMLVAAGCHWEQFHESNLENMEDYRFNEMPSPFVFHRSLPHAGKWPKIHDFSFELYHAGFKVETIFMIREMYACTMSVFYRDEKAAIHLGKNYREAIRRIPNDAGVVSYDVFVLDEKYRRWLFDQGFKLPFPESYVVYDGNSKYYR